MQSFPRALLLSATASLFALGAYAQQATAPPSAPSTASLPDSPDAQGQASPQPTGPTAVFDTSMGRITCKLFSKEAPKTVANFIGLAEGTKDWTNPAMPHQTMHDHPLYNGTIFHRVIPGFMIQGGDPLGTGEGDPGYTVPDEIVPGLNFDVAGRLAMANSGPGTDGSQFFITEAPYPSLNQRYTIFGQCDPHSVLVADSIADVERDARDKPLEPVILEKVTIVQNGRPLPAPPSESAAPATQPKQ